jgi:capsule polysaccharide export protein KpsE/RkpR
LSNEEEKHLGASDVETALMGVPVTNLKAALWRRRRWLATVTGLGLLLATASTFLIPSEYESTVQVMPPDQESLSGRAMLSSMLGSLTAGSLLMGDMGGGLWSGRTQGGTTIGILSSRTVQDDIINRFDLRRVYHRRLYMEARKDLAHQTKFTEDRKSGIMSITVTDKDPYRARDIAQAYIDELNKLVNSLSVSSARRERIFLETRLKAIKDDLDASSQALSQFSSRNAALDPEKQAEATVATAEKVQDELIVAQSMLSGLKATYTDDNARVREARERVDELQRQLTKMTGVRGNASSTSPASDQALPSVRELPLLGVTYYDLYRRITIEETLYEALTKQYELAKVQEAEDVPPVKVLDAPDVAEKRLSKHRALIMFFGMLVFAFAGSVWVFVSELWRITDNSHPAKALAIRVLHSTRRHNPVAPA